MLPPPALRDLILLATRVVLGLVLMAHGWQKYVLNGIQGTTGAFEKMGVPLPGVAAPLAGAVEFLGGALLLLGLLTPVAGVLVLGVMAGAFWFVHKDAGVFASDGGWELVAVIAAAAMQLAAAGPGRFSLDHALFGRRAKTRRAPASREGSRHAYVE